MVDRQTVIEPPAGRDPRDEYQERRQPEMLTNPLTGECIDPDTVSREALIEFVAEMQDTSREVRDATYRAQQALIRQMEADNATLAEAGDYKARIRHESRPDVKTLLNVRDHIGTEEFRQAFKTEYKPMKRALNELAKRGGVVRDIIEAGYHQEPKLTIERKGGAE